MDERKPLLSQVADGSLEDVSRNHRKARDTNHAGFLQAGVDEVRVCIVDNLVNTGNLVPKLRGEHADEPVIIRAREAAQNERWTEFPGNLVSLWKREEDDLAGANHLKDSLRSARV